MPHGLLKDLKGFLGPLAASQLGQVKAFILSYAEKKVYEYIELLKQQCPPPEVLKQMGQVLEKIKKLIEGFDKKVDTVAKLPKLLDPAIKAGKVVVEILAHLPIPSTIGIPPGPAGGVIFSIPSGILQAQSNLLVFMRKMIDTFETDIENVNSLLGQTSGIFNPIKSKLGLIEALLSRCAETPDIYGGSGFTWGRFTGGVEALASIELNLSGSSPLFPVGVIVVDDKGYILSAIVTGSFETGSVTTNTKVLIPRPETISLLQSGFNTVGGTLIGGVGTGTNNGTLIGGADTVGVVRLSATGIGTAGSTGAFGTGGIGAGGIGTGNLGTGTGGIGTGGIGTGNLGTGGIGTGGIGTGGIGTGNLGTGTGGIGAGGIGAGGIGTGNLGTGTGNLGTGTGNLGTGNLGTGTGNLGTGTGNLGTGTGNLGTGNLGTGTGNLGTGTGRSGALSSNGTFIGNTQSNTGDQTTRSTTRQGSGADGVTNRGTFFAGVGNKSIESGLPPTSTSPGAIPTNTGIFIGGQEIGITPEGRVALIASLDDTSTIPLLSDITYKAKNGETYFLSILEDESVEYVAPRRYAVAKDKREVIVLQGPKSFASNQQVLIDELKLRIDNQLP